MRTFSLHNTSAGRQRGVVLFIALVALVVMALASVALIRSVDTNTMIAGNLSFRQSALISADKGLETALNWLAANPASLTADSSASGYYASFYDLTQNVKDRPEINGKVLVNASGVPATGVDISAGKDTSGNTITYVIQRMCRAVGFLEAEKDKYCLLGPVGDNTGDKSVKDQSNVCPTCVPAGSSYMYRVTVRVVGPKNTTSYAEAYVY